MLEHIFQSPLTAKQKVLLTAHDLFYQQGIRATGIDKIIAGADVTKTTFYRHFPSKNSLIIEFLEYRHQLWMNWFTASLNNNSDLSVAIADAMRQWFSQQTYRGCAFINSLTEVSAELPDALNIIKRHKRQVASAIEKNIVAFLELEQNALNKEQQVDQTTPASKVNRPTVTQIAQTITMIMDGAIVRAQTGEDIEQTVGYLNSTVEPLLNVLSLELRT